MAAEHKAVSFGKGFHLRDDHRVGAQAAQTRQVGVVDDTHRWRIAPVGQSQMQEALHVEAVKDGIKLQIPALAVTQVKKAGLQAQQHRTHPQCEGAGVVLHLGPGLLGPTLAAQVHGRADAQLAQIPGEGGVLDRDAVLFPEFFRHPLGVAVALLVELAQEIRIDDLNRGTSQPGHLAGLGDDSSHGVAAEFESAGDLPNGHPLLVEKEHRLTFVRCDHRGYGGFW